MIVVHLLLFAVGCTAVTFVANGLSLGYLLDSTSIHDRQGAESSHGCFSVLAAIVLTVWFVVATFVISRYGVSWLWLTLPILSVAGMLLGMLVLFDSGGDWITPFFLAGIALILAVWLVFVGWISVVVQTALGSACFGATMAGCISGLATIVVNPLHWILLYETVKAKRRKESE